MHDELRALVSNRTWQIQQLPQNRRSIPCRWVYKNKLDGEGNLVRRKARLVAKGFTQRLGIDFEETFAPVAKMTSARTLIALATVRNWELDCVDVDNAYLNGDLKEEIYMEVPPGYDLIDPKPVPPGYALRLLKSLYGLKQAGRSWNEKIHESLVNLGFKECPSDPCIYARKTNGAFIGIVLYVDDLLLASNSRKELDAFKLDLSKLFKLKDLGPAKHILGIRIMRNRQLRTTKLDQEAYIKSIVKKFNLATASTTATPLPTGQQLSDSDSPSSNTEIAEMSKVPYLQALGSVMYAMIATRPDIAHSVGVLSRFSANPGRPHWEALKHLIRYLKGTSSLALTYSSKTSTPILSGYSDADFAADTDTRRSTSGYVFCINNTAISWASKKQPTPAASTAEAEYIALATGASELLWLEFILNHLDAPQRRPLTLHADNQAAISIAKNPTHHSRAKHIDVKYHFVRHRVVNGHINVVYIPTQSMLADIFTKTLPRDRHQALTRQLGLIGNTSN